MVATAIVVVILMGIGIYHKNFCHRVEEAVDNGVVETVEEQEAEEEPKAELEETETSSKAKSVAATKYGTVKNPTDKIQNVSFESATKPASTEATAGDVPAEIVIEDNSKEEADTEKAVEEAKENGDTVTELEDGIIAISKNEETKEDDSKEDLEKKDIEEEKESAEEVPSNTEEVVEEIENNTDCIEDTTSEDLDSMLESTTKEEEAAQGETKIADLTIIENKVQPVVPQEVKPVEKVEEVKAVSVTAIDGYTTTVGSSVQFRVEGDNVTVDGLDGISYSLNNGILTINVGSEATVLSVEVSNSVNAVAFDVVVNGVLQ